MKKATTLNFCIEPKSGRYDAIIGTFGPMTHPDFLEIVYQPGSVSFSILSKDISIFEEKPQDTQMYDKDASAYAFDMFIDTHGDLAVCILVGGKAAMIGTHKLTYPLPEEVVRALLEIL